MMIAETKPEQGPGATKLAAVIYFAALVAVIAYLWTSLTSLLGFD
jgi:hypothetical protein